MTTPPNVPPHMPKPLDYGRPDPTIPKPARLGGFSPRSFLSTAAPLVLMVVILSLVVPQFARVFADFKTDLPLLTVIVLKIGNALSNPILMGMAIAAAVAAGIFAGFLVQGRWARLLIMLLLVPIVVAVILALFLPYVQLMGNLGGYPAKP